MYKKVLSIILVLTIIMPMTILAEEASVSVSARSAVLIISDNGEVIYSKDKDIRLGMASTTKIMTAITVIEHSGLDTEVAVPKQACGVEGSSAYLYEGEKLTIRDLLYALMLQSANDAAVALALTVGGSIEDFCTLMNNKAAELGLKNTHFTNPHGLDDEEHYSSAYDLALIMAYAMKNESFREITSTYKYTSGQRLFVNHNRLLLNCEGCIGGKTGYTKQCGRCLVSVTERNGLELIAVTLDAPNDWNDHKALYDYGYSRYEKISPVTDGQYFYSVDIINSDTESLYAEAEPISFICEKGSYSNLKVVCELDRFYYAPVEYGEVLGYLVFFSDGIEVARSEIRARKSVKEIKYKKWWQKLLSLFIKDK